MIMSRRKNIQPEEQPLCEAEWALEVACPHPIAEVATAFRMTGYRKQNKCFLHRNDNVISRVLRLLTEKGFAVLMRCPHGCRLHNGDLGCECEKQSPGKLKARKNTFCSLEIEVAVETISLAAEQLCFLDKNLTPQQFRQMADLAEARLILRRLENHLAAHGLVEEVITTSDKGDRTTSGRVSSFLDARMRLMQLVRGHESDLGLHTAPEKRP
jgi:hypothetical protein